MKSHPSNSITTHPSPPHCLAIIQARMSSRRLPGKVLMGLAGKTVLGRVVDRVKLATGVSDIVVATSTDKSDDPIEAFCLKHQIKCFRGELQNVVARFSALLKQYKPKYFARISADSPLYDPVLLDRAIKIIEGGGYQIVSNVVKRSYPKGQSVEVISTDLFLKYSGQILDPSDQEHVTPFFYRVFSSTTLKGDPLCKIYSLENDKMLDQSQESLCIDEPVDIERLTKIIKSSLIP